MLTDIRFATPDISKAEIRSVNETIESRWITAGKKVEEFEAEVARKCLCKKAVAFDSCTAAMEMTLRILGIGPGDEVITTPYTYSATAEVIRNVGAKIVFVDLAPNSFEMDYQKLEEAITDRTKAIIPVDFGGKMCDYGAMRVAIYRKSDMFVPRNSTQMSLGRIVIVADAAHSFGAESYGMASGTAADFTCFSFHALKNVTTGGEGGAVVWDSLGSEWDDWAEKKLKLLRDHGQTSRNKESGWEYDIALFGYNHIMTNVDAAMGLAQLERFEELKDKRIQITCRYDELFDKYDYPATPLIQHFGMEHTSAMHLYPIGLPDRYEDGTDRFRNEVYKALKEMGVPCNVHYKPLPMMTAYKRAGFDIADYPNAYDMFRKVLTIPYHTELTEKEQEYIVASIAKAVKEVGA